mgnify:FL=1
MTKKETKKEVIKVKKLDELKDFKMEFNFEKDYLPEVITVSDVRLKDDTYFKAQIENVEAATNKSEEAKNIPVIINGAELMVKRLEVLKLVHKDANHPDKLRKLLVKELNFNIKEFNRANEIQFGASKKASRTSQLARMSKIAIMLSLFPDKIIVNEEKGKKNIFAVNELVKPVIIQYSTNTNNKEIKEKLLNPFPSKLVKTTNDTIEFLYKHHVNGVPLPKGMTLTSDSETDSVNANNSSSDTSSKKSDDITKGATAGTVSDDFEMLCTALHFMNGGKDAALFAKQTVAARFDKVVGIPHDPSKILLDRKNLLAIIDWLKIYAQQLANDEYCTQFTTQNEKQQEAFKETLQNITELGIGRLGETLKSKQA